jgi:hypothetical protein
MAFRFWYKEDDNINLGNPFIVLSAFREMAQFGEEWPALFGVIHTDDQDLDPGYVADVRKEAKDFLAAHEEEISKDAKAILTQLVVSIDNEQQ